jgi:hypothetical protein
MLKLSVADIISNIKSEIPFEAVSEDYSFTLKIRKTNISGAVAVHYIYRSKRPFTSITTSVRKPKK